MVDETCMRSSGKHSRLMCSTQRRSQDRVKGSLNANPLRCVSMVNCISEAPNIFGKDWEEKLIHSKKEVNWITLSIDLHPNSMRLRAIVSWLTHPSNDLWLPPRGRMKEECAQSSMPEATARRVSNAIECEQCLDVGQNFIAWIKKGDYLFDYSL